MQLWGRTYPVLLPSLKDPRLHVAAVIFTLQILGQTVLGFRVSIAQILVCLVSAALIEFLVGFFSDGEADLSGAAAKRPQLVLRRNARTTSPR